MWTPMSNEMFNCVGMITLITNKAELLLPVTASVPSNTLSNSDRTIHL